MDSYKQSWTEETFVPLGVLVVVVLVGYIISQPVSTPSVAEQLSKFRDGVLVRMSQGGCIGTLRWYTGTDFASDLLRFEKEYGQKYEANPAPLDASKILPPAALALTKPRFYDCKSAALAIWCLAAYYPNVSCEMYFSSTVDWQDQHVGMKCYEQKNNKTYEMDL